MAIYQLRTYTDLVAAVREELGIQSTDTTAISRIKRDINIVYNEVVTENQWSWLYGFTDVSVQAFDSAGTASVVVGSSDVILTVAPSGSKKGYYFSTDDFNEIYTIESHSPGSTNLKLSTQFTGVTSATSSYKIWTDRIPLPTDCKEIVKAWHDHYRQGMDEVSRDEYRRLVSLNAKAEDKPRVFTLGDFVDPSQTSEIPSLPSISSRVSSGVIKQIVFSSPLPAAIVSKQTSGAPIRWRISEAGDSSYNGDIFVSAISTTNLTNDTITYTGRMELQEAATPDSGIVVRQIDQTVDFDRYRELYIYPSLSKTRVTLHADYVKEIVELENDTDEPVIPKEYRIVLLYGALARAYRRARLPEESAANQQLYANTLAKMQGKYQENQDKPRLEPSRFYLGSKRNQSRSRSLGGSLGASTGGSSGAVVKGTANTVAVFNTAGEISGSGTISTDELNFLNGLTSNVQDQLDAITALSNGSILVGDSGGEASEVVPTGDVTISNTGVTAISSGVIVDADINASAAIARSKLASGTGYRLLTNDAAGVLSENAAIDADRALASDSNGQLVASVTTSDELGYVSGVTSAIQDQLDSKASNVLTDGHIFVGSASSIATDVQVTGDVTISNTGVTAISSGVIVDADINASAAIVDTKLDTISTTGKVANSATTATHANTSSAIVARDGSGDFSAGTITAALTGTASGNIPNTLTSATGDLIYASAPNTPTRLAAGAQGRVLTMGAAVPEWGVAAGSGGVNFIGQTTSWESLNLDDRTLDGGLGNWAAFADAASALPTDLTGGSPTVTCTRSTSNPLNGAGSLVITKDAANRQGEGCSVPFNVQPSYQGQTATITFPVHVVSGSLVQGDVKVFVYNVTKSELITPFNNDILGSQITAIFPTTARDSTPVNHEYRLGIYFASTSTTAVTIKADDFSIAPYQAVFGTPSTPWVSYTPTGSWNTNTTYTGQWRRVGDTMELSFKVSLSGAPNNTALLDIYLPSGYTADTTKLASGTDTVQSVGNAVAHIVNDYPLELRLNSTTSLRPVAGSYGGDGSGTDVVSAGISQTAPATWGSGNFIAGIARIPIVGWSSNVQMSSSASFKISSYLANGTRVTGAAPTVLGTYRSYLRGAGVSTLSETNGSPTTAPTAADGIRIWTASTYASADTSNQPSAYDIFVGKGKVVGKIVAYRSAGRTDPIIIDPYVNNGATTAYGLNFKYDDVTGILYVRVNGWATGPTNMRIGLDVSSGSNTSDGYFDVVMSENALAVGVGPVRSMVSLTSGNGHGSINTKIRRYSNVLDNKGTAITYSDSVSLGASFIINEDGIYSVCVQDYAAGNFTVGVSVNSTQLTTDIPSINDSDIFCSADGTSAVSNGCSRTYFLAAGSVVRVHTDGNPSTAGTASRFSIIKVSN